MKSRRFTSLCHKFPLKPLHSVFIILISLFYKLIIYLFCTHCFLQSPAESLYLLSIKFCYRYFRCKGTTKKRKQRRKPDYFLLCPLKSSFISTLSAQKKFNVQRRYATNRSCDCFFNEKYSYLNDISTSIRDFFSNFATTFRNIRSNPECNHKNVTIK